MARVFEYPLGLGGLAEDVDRIFTPDDRLSAAQNVRVDRAGRLEVRSANSALPTTTYSASALVAYDLANYNGRLVALGDQCGLGRPTDLFEYVDAVSAWRATAAEDDSASSGPRLPRSTAAREVGRVADLDASVLNVSVAAGAGYVCAVANLEGGTCQIHIFNPETDQSLVQVTRSMRLARAVFAGSDFWIVGQSNANDDLIAENFDPLTDKTLTGSTLVAASGTFADLAVAQTGASDFSVAYANGSDVTVSRFNSAGAVQSTFNAFTGLSVGASAVAICGNAAGTRITVAIFESSSSAYTLTTKTQTGSAVAGPTSLFAGATDTNMSRLAICQSGTQISICGVESASGTENVVTQLCTNESLHTLGSVIRYADAVLTSAPVAVTSGGQTNFYYGAADYLASVGEFGTNQLVEQATRLPQIFKDAQLAGELQLTNAVNGSALLGTRLYWGNTRRSIAPVQRNTLIPGGTAFSVTELEMNDSGRRQMAMLSNQLHIAGALPLVYDSRLLGEQGFAEAPVCQLTAGTAGALTLLGTYNVVTVWELVDAKGNIVRAQASRPRAITLTGAQDSITATSTTPHSLRRHPLLQSGSGVTLRVGFYRTTANDSNFHIDQYVTISSGDEFGARVSATLIQSDVALEDNAVLYEQSQTPVPHVAPPPYQFTWPARERQFVGGLPDEDQWAFSKLAFPSEPVNFAPTGELGFFGRAARAITAVAAFETVGITFTETDIAQISGRGPERNGQGEFDAAIRIPSPGGCIDWRSLADTPAGLFFQMAPDMLMMLSRDGSVSWVGAPVRDTLASFPVIVGAVHVRSEMLVAFACNDSDGSAGRLLIYDLANQQWSVDTVEGPVSALSELNGRLAFVSGGVVYLQDEQVASGSGALPTMRIERGFRIFQSLGYGTVCKIGLLVSYLGDCTVEGFISYDDSKTWVSMGTQPVTNAALGLAAGDPYTCIFVPKRREVDRFALRFDVTHPTNTGGVRLHTISVEAEAQEFMTRQPARSYR